MLWTPHIVLFRVSIMILERRIWLVDQYYALWSAVKPNWNTYGNSWYFRYLKFVFHFCQLREPDLRYLKSASIYLYNGGVCVYNKPKWFGWVFCGTVYANDREVCNVAVSKQTMQNLWPWEYIAANGTFNEDS